MFSCVFYITAVGDVLLVSQTIFVNNVIHIFDELENNIY